MTAVTLRPFDSVTAVTVRALFSQISGEWRIFGPSAPAWRGLAERLAQKEATSREKVLHSAIVLFRAPSARGGGTAPVSGLSGGPCVVLT